MPPAPPPPSPGPWIPYALASGACAAATAVLAKLSTAPGPHATTLLATTLHLPPSSAHLLLRALLLALNLAGNAAMWALFTRALTAATDALRVSVVNTGANFAGAALLGRVVFGERVPGLWWVGAAMLGAGSVIIGTRGEGGARGAGGSSREGVAVGGRGRPGRPGKEKDG